MLPVEWLFKEETLSSHFEERISFNRREFAIGRNVKKWGSSIMMMGLFWNKIKKWFFVGFMKNKTFQEFLQCILKHTQVSVYENQSKLSHLNFHAKTYFNFNTFGNSWNIWIFAPKIIKIAHVDSNDDFWRENSNSI